MADNVTITPGSGAIVASDELTFNGTTAQFQMTKPGWGALDSFNPITAGAGGLPVVSQSQGNVASAATDAGNPVKTGGVFNTTLPTLTTGQRGDTQITTKGETLVALSFGGVPIFAYANASDAANNVTTVGLVTRSWGGVYNGSSWDKARGDVNGAVNQPHAMTASRWQFAGVTGGIVNSTVAATLQAAGGAGVRNYLAGLQIDNDTLGAVTEVAVRDGAAGTVIWRGKLQITAGNRQITFPVPLKGTAATLMEFVVLTAVTGGVYVSAQGYTAT